MHHQSKGYQGNKETSERACGSSVFGRDPDAIMSIDRLAHSGKAMRAEFVLRDYPQIDPIDYWFDHPLCVLDEKGELAACKVSSGAPKPTGQGKARQLAEIERACDQLLGSGNRVKCADVAKTVGVKSSRVKECLENSERYELRRDGNPWYAVPK